MLGIWCLFCEAKAMFNPYQSFSAKILKIKDETSDTKLYTLSFINKKLQQSFDFIPGQFLMAGFPGFGEAPFDICSNPLHKNFFQICIRTVGKLTKKFHQFKKGEKIFIRGPFGNGFPDFVGKNLLLVGGGCGFVPFKSILDQYSEISSSSSKIQVFYGCLDQESLLFKDRYKIWRKLFDLEIILEKPGKSWRGYKGLVTQLFDQVEVIKNALAFLVGPPIMYKFVIPKLKEHKFSDQEIYLSLERKMDCGIGICQHCAVGPKYVCKDGPVFAYKELKEYWDAL